MTAVKFLNFCYQAYYLSLALYSLLFYKPFLIENCSICVLARLPQRQTLVNSILTNSVLKWNFEAENEQTVFQNIRTGDLCLDNRTIARCNILISGLIIKYFPM